MKKKYVKKRVIIEAEQLPEPFVVPTLEGTMHGRAGDYLVTGTAGEQYPVAKEIFENIYEEVK